MTTIKNKKSSRLIRAPRGFHFKISHRRDYNFDGRRYNGEHYIQLYNSISNRKIGSIFLEPYGTKTFCTHSNLDIEYRGQGLGAIMYARAIQWCLDNGYKVRSSGSSSEDAERVWGGKSIRRNFFLRRRLSPYGRATWYVLNKKAA